VSTVPLAVVRGSPPSELVIRIPDDTLEQIAQRLAELVLASLPTSTRTEVAALAEAASDA
jgi:hypothetical protein